MKRLIVAITVICISQSTFSQTSFRDGFVITNAKDTLTGVIDYREDARAYKSCDFKRSQTEELTTYEPGNIIGYGYKNDRYL